MQIRFCARSQREWPKTSKSATLIMSRNRFFQTNFKLAKKSVWSNELEGKTVITATAQPITFTRCPRCRFDFHEDICREFKIPISAPCYGVDWLRDAANVAVRQVAFAGRHP